MANEFADWIKDQDSLGGDRTQTARVPLQAGPTAEPQFQERCPKCQGTGRYGNLGACFKCKGKGQRSFKTSAADRAKARDAKAASAERKLTTWAEAHPTAWAWINRKAPSFGFAAAMQEAVRKYGSLTEKQLAAVERCIANDAERTAARAVEQAARTEAAPVINTAPLEAAYAQARENGIRFPKLPLLWESADKKETQTFLFKTSAKGPIYVTDRGQYLGKVTGGKFFRVRECDDETERRIVAICADPKGAAQAYGRVTGSCCKCGRELTNKASIELGIGPICASKYGW